LTSELRVLVDLWAVHPLTGIFRYGVSIINELAPIVNWKFTVATSSATSMVARNALSGAVGNVVIKEISGDRKVLRMNSGLYDEARSGNYDLYFTPDYLPIADCPLPYIFAIHDAIRLQYPECTYRDDDIRRFFGHDELERLDSRRMDLLNSGFKSRFRTGHSHFLDWFDLETRKSILGSLQVITPSASSLSEIKIFWPEVEGLASVVPAGIDSSTFRRRTRREVQAVVSGLNITKPFLLFVGGALRGHKRMDVVVNWHRAARQIESKIKLVVVAHGEFQDSVLGPLRDDIRCGKVIVTGPISDSQLASLYSTASATIIASENEGFCLPAREALACGCQIVTPRLAALADLSPLTGRGVFWLELDAEFDEALTVWSSVIDRSCLVGLSVAPYSGDGWAGAANTLKVIIDAVIPRKRYG